MKNFEIDSMKEKIYFGKTKEYFEEVLSSYQIGSYRSSVVMLWAVAVADLVYKLQHLVDLYADASAKSILDDVRNIQNEDARSSSWELGIIDNVFENTNLIDSAEYENLRYLQKQRHLCAHPVLRENLDLHKPNKETVRSLIRNTLEGILVKPPFYTQKAISEILEDLDEAKDALPTQQKLKTYVESRYLNRMNEDIEFSLFRTIWKLTFKLNDEKCNENRLVNLRLLKIISNRHRTRLNNIIEGDIDYYSNIAGSGYPLDYLVNFLSLNEALYDLLNQDAKLKINYASENTLIGKTCGWFVRGGLDQHFDYLKSWIESDENPEFEEAQWEYLLNLSDSEEWENYYSKLIATYYGASPNFDSADIRFSQHLLPNLKYFKNIETIEYLLNKIENNNQVYWRGRAAQDHKKVREMINRALPKGFDYSGFRNFYENTRTESESESG